jgi:hypothetical protein
VREFDSNTGSKQAQKQKSPLSSRDGGGFCWT